jgi:hypothetical protein
MPGSSWSKNLFLETVPGDRTLIQIAYQSADDGSYFPKYVPEPTLVTGKWRTDRFLPYEYGIKRDAGRPAPSSPSRDAMMG